MSVIYLLSKEASVRKVGGRLRVERGCEVLQSVPIHDVTCLVASRCAHVSMPVIFDLMDVHAGIFFVDGRGRIVGQVEGKALSWERSQRQARMFADVYRGAENPLEGLSAGELAALAFAVGGYRAWAHLTAPGYFLLRTLGEMDPAAQATRFPWRCKHASFVRVLDDEVLAAASVAIAHGRLLSFVYHGQAVRVRMKQDLEEVLRHYEG